MPNLINSDNSHIKTIIGLHNYQPVLIAFCLAFYLILPQGNPFYSQQIHTYKHNLLYLPVNFEIYKHRYVCIYPCIL